MSCIKRAVVGLCAATVVGFYATSGFAQGGLAPKTVDFLASTEISGFVSTTYGYDFAGSAAQGGTFMGGGIGPRFNDFSVPQFVLRLEKPTGDDEWSAGYRVDIVGGQDSGYVSGGLGASNLTLAQAYFTARIPVGDGIILKGGKFYAPFGNEVFESVGNFNITRSMLFLWAQPTTLTGLQGSYTFQIGENATLDVLAGITNGWDQVADVNSSKSYYTQASLTFWEGKAQLATGVIYGPEQAGTDAPDNTADSRILWDSIATVKPIENLTLSLNFDWGSEDFDDAGADDNQWWGVSGVANYKFNDFFDASLRGEYFSDDNEDSPGFNRTGTDQDLWSVTATANFNIWKNLVTRLEIRYTSSSEDVFPDDGSSNQDDNFLVAVEAAYLY